ncbi:MAG: hypothetical protein Q9182_006147 [Xanthomendoza sp. 2 TL-2023]
MAGEYWLMKPVDQEPAWPVYICPEEIVWEYFKSATNRPHAARRTDGTFSKTVGRSQQLLPVLYLGSLRMAWAKRIHLEQLDFATAVNEKDNNPNVILAHAYAELIEQYGEADAQYWSSRLLAKRLAEEDSGDGGEEAVVPEPVQDVGIAEPAERDFSRRAYSDDGSDEEDLRSHALNVKRVKLESAGNTQSSSLSWQPAYRAPSEATPAAQDSHIKVEAASRVRIYVDNPHKVFSVRHSSLDEKSPVLATAIQYSPAGSYMMAPWLSDISADEFRFVVEYINSGEYHPYIMDAGTDGAHLAEVLTAQAKKEEVLKCGAIHVLAHRFDMPALQTLIISKLKVLQPFPEREFLAMTQLAFGTGLSGRDGLDKLVVDYMVDHFYELMKIAIDQVKDLLATKPQLGRQVFAIMACINEPQHSIKEEAKTEAVAGGDDGIPQGAVTDENTRPSGVYLTDLQAETTTEYGIPIFEDAENDNDSPMFDRMSRTPLSELFRD